MMNKLLKIIQVLVFTVLLLIIGVFVWQFFNAYARLLLLPLGVLSIYYLLIYSFARLIDRKSTRLNSSHVRISYAVFCLKKKKPGKGRCRFQRPGYLA